MLSNKLNNKLIKLLFSNEMLRNRYRCKRARTQPVKHNNHKAFLLVLRAPPQRKRHHSNRFHSNHLSLRQHHNPSLKHKHLSNSSNNCLLSQDNLASSKGSSSSSRHSSNSNRLSSNRLSSNSLSSNSLSSNRLSSNRLSSNRLSSSNNN